MTKEVFIENVGRKCAVYYGRRPEEFCPSSILLNENIKNLPCVFPMPVDDSF